MKKLPDYFFIFWEEEKLFDDLGIMVQPRIYEYRRNKNKRSFWVTMGEEWGDFYYSSILLKKLIKKGKCVILAP